MSSPSRPCSPARRVPSGRRRRKKEESLRTPTARVHVQRPVDPKLKQQQTLGKRPNGNQNACSPANKRPFREPCRDSVELLDRIWKEMDEDDRRKQSEEEQAEISSPNGSPSGPHIPTPTPTQQTLKLTRVELGNASRDDSLMRRFMDKPGLMERILGYKMLHARVVPYEMMRYPAKLDECEHPDSSDVDYGVKLEVEVLPPPSTSKVQLQTAPPIRLPARGPKTPPGSPQHDPDDGGSAEEWGLKSGPESPVHAKAEKPVEPLQTISPLPPPPPPVIIERDSQEEILHTVSQATNTPIDQVKAIIGEELHNAIGRVDRSVLLCTLKDAIRRVTKAPQATDSPALTGACDMEDSSTDSNASADQKSNSPLLLPPPPAPPAPPPAASIGEFQPPPRSIGMPPMHQSHFQAAPQRWEPPQPMFARESHVFVPPFSVVQPPAQPLGPPQFAAPQFIRHPPPRPLIDMSRPPPLLPRNERTSTPLIPISSTNRFPNQSLSKCPSRWPLLTGIPCNSPFVSTTLNIHSTLRSP
ncbi:hypothetical protein M3Y99_00345700 [Aphelenchoides fujianensis]|nr:hypothetical protein M3Y99_00345700 [Aphelenchoides fujianensis]